MSYTTATIETLIQDIGREASQVTGRSLGKFLLYAEVEEGVISADLLYPDTPGGPLRFRFCPESLRQLIRTFWIRWQEQPENQEWRTMSYFVDDGELSIDFGYLDTIHEDQDVIERRSEAVTKYFGAVKIDYSRPKSMSKADSGKQVGRFPWARRSK
jgi:hypothetical protein